MNWSNMVLFTLLFPIICFIYYIIYNRTWRNIVLMLVSLLLYAWMRIDFAIAILIISIIDYIWGWIMERLVVSKKVLYRGIFIFGIILNLAPLVIARYVINETPPIGMSVFTFQSLSYLGAVYRREIPYQRNYLKLFLSIALFPQMIGGPIVRYPSIYKQISDRTETLEGVIRGFFRFSIGIGKIILLAAYGEKIVKSLFSEGLVELSAYGAWVGITVFSFQIYFTLSGISDMSIGISRIFGFDYEENFNYPYTSRSITDFWRRWNISWNSFLEDYIVAPLDKKGYPYLGLLIISVFIGTWYGKSWNFIVWGICFAALMIFEKKLLSLGFDIKNVPIASNIMTIILVTLGWSLFYFHDLNDLHLFFKVIFGLSGTKIELTFHEKEAIYRFFWVITIMIVGVSPYPRRFFLRFKERLKGVVKIVQVIMSVAICVLSLTLIINQGIDRKETPFAMLNKAQETFIDFFEDNNELKSFTKRYELLLDREVKIYKTNGNQEAVSTIEIPEIEKEKNKNSQREVVEQQPSVLREMNEAEDTKEQYIQKITEDYLVLNDKVLRLFHYDPQNIKYCAQQVNYIMDNTPERINKYFLVAPLAISFENEKYKRYSDNLANAIKEIYSFVSTDVTTIDTYESIKAYKDEYIYLKTDDQWTARGAYYAAKAFANKVGINMIAIDNYEMLKFSNFIGSQSVLIDTGLEGKITDDVEYFLLDDGINKQLITDIDFKGELRSYESPAIALSRRGYNIFIGGRFSSSILYGEERNGKVLMIIGDSYMKAFALWLTPYYEKVIVINSDYFEGDKSEIDYILEDEGVTDFMILVSGVYLNDPSANSRMKGYFVSK